MKILNKIILGFFAFFEIFENWLVRISLECAQAMLFQIYSLPGIVQYKSQGGLKYLREVCDILESLDLVNFVVGGYAYDISVGKITRHHRDIDVAIMLDGDATRMLEGFASHGFQVSSDKSSCRLTKHKHSIDVFYWRSSDDGCVVRRQGDMQVRMPNCYFSYSTKYLFGEAYRVASDEYCICIEPFVHFKDSMDYILQLKQNSPITCRCSEEEIVDTVTVFNFDGQCREKRFAA